MLCVCVVPVHKREVTTVSIWINAHKILQKCILGFIYKQLSRQTYFLTHKEIFLLLYNKKKTFHVQGKKVRIETISYLLPQVHVFKRICNFLQICMLWPLYTSSWFLKFLRLHSREPIQKNAFSFIRESSVANQPSALTPIHKHLTKHFHEHTLLLFCNIGKPCLHLFLHSLAVIYQTSSVCDSWNVRLPGQS